MWQLSYPSYLLQCLQQPPAAACPRLAAPLALLAGADDRAVSERGAAREALQLYT